MANNNANIERQKGTFFTKVPFLMRAKPMLLCVGLMVTLTAHTQHTQKIDFKSVVKYLASDSMNGRPAGTMYEKQAGNFIIGQMMLTGIEPAVERYIQSFSFADEDHIVKESCNLLGKISLDKPTTVIIGAHYDHLSEASAKSREILKRGVHNGADDNASGVAMALRLAEEIARQPDQYNHNFLFAFYSAHEVGLYGSGALAVSQLFDSLEVALVINIDMVGRLDDFTKTVSFNCFNLGDNWSAKLDSLQLNTQLNLRVMTEKSRFSDDKVFRDRGFKTLSITTGVHDDYHKHTDDWHRINYRGMEQIADNILRLLRMRSSIHQLTDK